MRLLTVDFLNVNSLAGHWHIDFTVPDYRSSPLFAITGSTGTGKSSILDAIALALYGETPRVKSWGEKKKDVAAGPGRKDSYDESCPMLTKGTKEIRAGVRFEAGGRIFASSWRRYVKRTGTLSAAQVELIEYASPEDTEGRVLTTKTSEWNKLVVDVTKMTFDTFTRSVLLAQGAFSNFLKASDDARAQILEDITGTDIYSDIGSRIYRRWDNEEKTLADMKARTEASAPLPHEERLALEEAHANEKARLVDEDARRKALEAALAWRRSTDAARVTLTEKTRSAEAALKARETHAPETLRAKRARAALEPIRLLRESEAVNKARLLEEVKIAKVAERLDALTLEMPRLEAALAKTTSQKTLAREALDAFAVPYRAMIEIDSTLSAARDVDARHSAALLRAEKTAAESLKRSSDAQRREEAAREAVESDRLRFEAEREDDEIEPHLQALTANLTLMTEKEKRLAKEMSTLEAARQKLARREAQLEKAANEEKPAADEAKRLRSAQIEALRIYETAKGSETPEKAFEAVAGIAARMAAAGELMHLVEDRDFFRAGMDARATMLEANPDLAGFLSDVLARFEARTDAVEAREPGLAAALAAGLPGYLETLRAEKAAVIDHTAEVGRLREAADAAEGLARKAEQAAERALRERLSQEAAAQSERDALKDLETGTRLLTRETEEAREAFRAALARIPTVPEGKSPDAVVALLQAKVERRRAFLEAMTRRREAHAALKESAALLLRDKENAEHAKTLALQEKKASEERTAKLAAERLERYGDTNPQNEKTRLEGLFAAADKADTQAQNALRAAREEKATLAVRDEELKRSARKLRENEEKTRADCGRLMAERDFADRETLLAAALDEKTIEAIEARTRQLNDDALRLAGQKAQAEETLAELEARALSEEGREVLEEKTKEAEQLFIDSTRRTAELGARLDADDKKREENAKELKAIERQQQICGDWDRLRQLIGSADGKAFRTAAQKITFRILLQYANEAMETMTARYWLHAAGEGGLSVDVVDNDMGGQIRTAKNLSGGECFLVSLSLALGLSRMGGKNLRVDTLFLDEGFGTLDDTTLNNALYALENLQAASGKLIGIISHVKSVKERIQNHITVTQRAGSGLSTLRGPGVTRLAD